MNKRKIILDVDTGTDDAIALMAAILSDAFEIVGVTTVAGNLPLPQTTANTLRVVSLLAPHIPVIRGCAQPLVRDLDPRRKFCDNEETRQGIALHSMWRNSHHCLPPHSSHPVRTLCAGW